MAETGTIPDLTLGAIHPVRGFALRSRGGHRLLNLGDRRCSHGVSAPKKSKNERQLLVTILPAQLLEADS